MATWYWQELATADEVHQVLQNGAGTGNAIADFRVAATRSNGVQRFFLFYTFARPSRRVADWGWVRADAGIDSALSHINGASSTAFDDFEVCAVPGARRSEDVFYVFYTRGSDAEGSGAWGWVRRESPHSAVNVLNGWGTGGPVTATRITAVTEREAPVYYSFYQRLGTGPPACRWRAREWRSASDVAEFLSGHTQWPVEPSADVDVTASAQGPGVSFTTFSTTSSGMRVVAPLAGERFAVGERVALHAQLGRHVPLDGGGLRWESDVDGPLGSGARLTTDSLSLGPHVITVSGYDQIAEVPVRIMSDLWTVYRAAPSPAEIARLQSYHLIDYHDGDGSDEDWEPYSSYDFDQDSLVPNKLAFLAKLDILRRQRFEVPLPFPDASTIYDHVTAHVEHITLRLDCAYNSGEQATRGVRLNRVASMWHNGIYPQGGDCKSPPDPVSKDERTLIGFLQLLVHESRHTHAGEPGHVDCPDGRQSKDQQLFDGSGFAWATLYLMWVYRYGRFDSPQMRQAAADQARQHLNSSFCDPPSHPDPRVQSIIDELLDSDGAGWFYLGCQNNR